MGIFAVSDMSDLDIAWATRKRLAPTRDPSERYVEIADRLCEMGRLGQKVGAGWYRYADGSREGQVDQEVRSLIDAHRHANGIAPRRIDPDEIVGRMMAATVREAEAIVGDGIAEQASDVDLAFVRGFGFPETKGGPVLWWNGADMDRFDTSIVSSSANAPSHAPKVGQEQALCALLATFHKGISD